MTAAVMVNARQPSPSQCTSAAATSPVAPISAATLARSSPARSRGTSWSTACKAEESRAERPSSLAPALDIRSRAVSALTHQPASRISAIAATSSHPIGGSPQPFPAVTSAAGVAVRRRPRRGVTDGILVAGLMPGGTRPVGRLVLRPPRRQQPVLQAEHGGVVLSLRVIVAEQMQDAVHGEQFHLD